MRRVSAPPPAHHPPHHPIRTALAVAAAFGSGMLVALQSRINGELARQLSDSFVAAFISFGSGLLLLSIALAFWAPGRRGTRRVVDAVRTRGIPWWYVVGGAAGAFFVLSQGLVVGLVGVALFTVGIVAGQIVSSSVIDRRGLGSMAAKPLTAQRIVGAVLALASVALAVSGELRSEVPFAVLIIPFIAGIAVGWQQAVNGQVRAVAGSAFTATFGNFLVGATLLAIALGVHLLFAPWPSSFPSGWWLYTGGAVGCIFIFAQAAIVRTTGVLLMGLALLSGQLVAAALFDLLLPVPGHEIAVVTLIGTVITLVAVLIVAIPGRRTPPTTASSGTSSD